MPPTMFWDASALAKRYAPEPGSDTAEALFTHAPRRMITTPWGYSETYSLLRRKREDRRISTAVFTQAVSALQLELLGYEFDLLTVDDDAILYGAVFIERYSLNSVDAALLTTWLRYVQALPTEERSSCVLVAADQRLVRAAIAEGLTALNPETFPAADVPTFLASL